jgi:pimeloyl-ACP methyl ester carboxylesterase
MIWLNHALASLKTAQTSNTYCNDTLKIHHFAELLVLVAAMIGFQAQAQSISIGLVLMHGKGGSPTKFVADLASMLEGRGIQVANLEMPWSARRGYDVSVESAEAEVEAALARLRANGVAKVFVAGHSQGGIFALYFGGKHAVDGVVAIAPGGNVGSNVFREKVVDALALARKNVEDGKGADKVQLSDYEGSKGTYPLLTTSANYVQWFDPEGAMNQVLAIKAITANTPVLYIAPVNDYPALARANGPMFELMAKHSMTRLFEPASSHLNAPTASAQTIGEWLTAVANNK